MLTFLLGVCTGFVVLSVVIALCRVASQADEGMRDD